MPSVIQDNFSQMLDYILPIGQCKNLNGGCQHQCDYDRSKGVHCGCYTGFKLDSDGKSCIGKSSFSGVRKE